MKPLPPSCPSTGLYLTASRAPIEYGEFSRGVRGNDILRMFRAYAHAVGNERLFTPDWQKRTCPTCGAHRCIACDRKHLVRRCCR